MIKNIFGSSSEIFHWQSLAIFRNFWEILEMLGIIPLAFRQLSENLQKSSESGQKSFENCQKHRYLIMRILYNRQKIIWLLEDTKFLIPR